MKIKSHKKELCQNIHNENLLEKRLSRRQLLMTMGAASGTMLIPSIEKTEEFYDNEIQTIRNEVDVLVVGGGTAGTIAGIQSAKLGVKTAILEKGSQLGGTMTTGGVDFPGLFFAWGKQVIGGLGWKLVKRTVELNNDTMPDFLVPYGENHSRHHVKINGSLYAALAEEECLKAGVILFYYELPITVKYIENGWELDIVGKGIRRKIICKQLIDCTGGADIVGMIGLPRMREDVIQPGTLIFEFSGYDVTKLNTELIEKLYKEALQNGILKEGDFSSKSINFMHFLKTGGRNSQHIFDADSSSSVTHTLANIEGRKSLLRLLKFVRSLPGCEKVRLVKMSSETGVRETFRIVGETIITHSDFINGRIFEDAICYSFYPIDVHDKNGVEPNQLKQGIIPTIPLRALIPKNSKNLLIAGRSVSSDRLANSALRVQASCMAMGQAAGASAALAIKLNLTPYKIPLDKLRQVLKDYGVILPV